MEFVIYIALVLTGVCLGSYAAATVWRLRAKQLQFDKDAKEPYDHKEYSRLKKLLGKKTTEDRSRCLECGHALKWYDLIPLVSWISLRGKCRYCRHKIGYFEPAMEIGVALFFVLSYIFWPGGVETGLEITHFLLWLAAGVIMAMLFAYDAKWFLLPDILTFALIIVGLGIVGVVAAQTQDLGTTILAAIASVAALGGLYAVLYGVSRGNWVGFGDVKLGIALGLLLVDWQLALLAVFLANLIGCIIVIPLLVSKKLKRNSHIPFGPLLISGTVVALFIGGYIIDWYIGGMGI